MIPSESAGAIRVERIVLALVVYVPALTRASSPYRAPQGIANIIDVGATGAGGRLDQLVVARQIDGLHDELHLGFDHSYD